MSSNFNFFIFNFVQYLSRDLGDDKTVNDLGLVDVGIGALCVLGPMEEAEMTMGGEDFAFYSQKIPGVFVQLGIRNEEKSIIYPHHHPKFDVDEDVLWQGVATYVLLAKKYLELN